VLAGIIMLIVAAQSFWDAYRSSQAERAIIGTHLGPILIGSAFLLAVPLLLSGYQALAMRFHFPLLPLRGSPTPIWLFLADVLSYFALTIGGLITLLTLRAKGRFQTPMQKLLYALALFVLGLAAVLGVISLYVTQMLGGAFSGIRG
jgi:hypothetical protein